MARPAKQRAFAAVLLSSLIISLPVRAESESERVLQEVNRLSVRMAQLEADNARLKGEFGDLKLTRRDIEDIIAFMKTLTDGWQSGK